jgi:DNA-binding response OmpR family regulator
MRRAGYATLRAKSGEEALEIARREQPCVVVALRKRFCGIPLR